MSSIIPPLVSSSPPPMLPEDDEEDYFVDFATSNDYSLDDGLSLPSTPQRNIPTSTYHIDVSPPLEDTSEEAKEVNSNYVNEFKDNTSQDSVMSIVTSDSGLSEIHSSCSEEPPELISDTKDYLDVRNETEVGDEKYHKDKRKEEIETENFVNNKENKAELDSKDSTGCVESEDVDEKLDICEELENEKIEPVLDDDFADFECADQVEMNEDDDDFGDFNDFPTPVVNSESLENDDDFDDFADYSTAVSSAQVVSEPIVNNQYLDVVRMFSQKPNRNDSEKLSNFIREIFQEAFPSNNNDSSENEVIGPDLLKGCTLWDRIDDVENLKPLSYKWENSECYKKYLNVINMDIRNILCGNNLSMPRFAANLATTPLEPLKPVPVEVAPIMPKQDSFVQPDIPKQDSFVQPVDIIIPPDFDMAPSYIPKKETEQEIVSTIEKETFNPIILPTETESIKTLKLNNFEPIKSVETTPSFDSDDEFSNFHSVPTPQISNPISTPIILEPKILEPIITPQINYHPEIKPIQPSYNLESNLRETHISTEEKTIIPEPNFTIPEWTEPESKIETNNTPLEEEEDDFADFQAANNPIPITQPYNPIILNPTVLTPAKTTPPIKVETTPQINWPDPGVLETDLERLSSLNKETQEDDWSDFVSTKPPKNSDDDWSDFVSSNAPPKNEWMEPPNFTSWNSPSPFTPNIISNPSHFDYNKYSNNSFSNYQQSSSRYQTQTTLQTMKGKNTVSTISALPELDFMTPKSIIRSKGTKK